MEPARFSVRRVLDPVRLIVVLVAMLSALFFLSVTHASGSALLDQRKGELERTQVRIDALQAEMDRVTESFAHTVAEIARTENDLERARRQEEQARVELAEKKAQLEDRLVDMYKQNYSSFPVVVQVLMGEQDLARVLEVLPHVARVAQEDKTLVDQVQGLMLGLQTAQKEIDREQTKLRQQQRKLQATRGELDRLMKEAEAERSRLAADVSVLTAADNLVQKADRARSAWRRHTPAGVWRLARGFAFPVDGPHSYFHDWGFPRSNERTHKGTDIMAATGTPVVAVVGGVVSRIEYGQNLGGTIIWLRGDNGVSYYYAHLERILPGIRAGQRVVAGLRLATVGATGNAAGGAPHLHFQMHPGGGAAADPYPVLRISD